MRVLKAASDTFLVKTSDCADKIGSFDPVTMDGISDIELGIINENKPTPGMWRFPTNQDLCCIYRVPHCLRRENLEAYTPQLVLIGPLHRSLKSKALKSRGDITDAKSMGYLNMDRHKKIYLAEFTKRLEGKKGVIDGFRRMIEDEEEIIRASYSESTTWIESPEFVDMVLHDSVFILEFMLRCSVRGPAKIGDALMDESCLAYTVTRDLIMLENQLPYFILEKLFDPIVPIFSSNKTFRELVVKHFELDKYIKCDSKFRHFTDMIRCVRVESLPPEYFVGEFKHINHMYNADKLYNGGVTFKAVEDEYSIGVKFENGILEIPPFYADDEVEITLRNIMALEQCHYPLDAHVCDYIIFLDYLIDTEKDVELLVEKGIVNNWIGDHGAVAKMMNKLCLGVVDEGSHYSEIALRVKKHYKNKCNKSHGILRRVYCNNLWRGTATVTAVLLLLLTLTQTVTSIIDVLPKNRSP